MHVAVAVDSTLHDDTDTMYHSAVQSLTENRGVYRNAGGQNDEHRHKYVNHRVGLGVKRHIALHGMLMAYHHLV